ncbi:MAG: cytochrome C oxidase subunit III [Opitutus sp.]|nr:cytochrome C oxidase subunit III [Opitutus sp.]
MNETRTLDVSGLPDHAFGHRSPMWWGTFGVVVIEGMMFAALLATYLYVRGHAETWPLAALPPDLTFGTINLLVLLASCVPNHLYKQAAVRHDLGGVRRWLVVSIVFALGFCVVRVFEFQSLNCRWNDNAYASAVWALLGFHTLHLVTDLLDTVVLAVLMFTGPITGKRFVDVSENAAYWYFVVLAWLPIYGAIYLLSRWS